MVFNKKYLVFLLLIVFNIHNPVFAGMTCQDNTDSRDPYGNAQSTRFRCAMIGCPLTPQEAAELARIIPESIIDHFYGRVSVNASSFNLYASNSNNVGFIGYPGTASVRANRATRYSSGAEFAIGYIFAKDYHGEIEYLANKVINFNTNITTNINGTLVNLGQESVRFHNNTVLANLYYDFQVNETFIPFVCGGIGVAVNQLTLQDPSFALPPFLITASSPRIASFAWEVGLGFRLRFFTRWFINASYRYIGLGNAQVNAIVTPPALTQTVRAKPAFGQSALSLGVIIIF